MSLEGAAFTGFLLKQSYEFGRKIIGTCFRMTARFIENEQHTEFLKQFLDEYYDDVIYVANYLRTMHLYEIIGILIIIGIFLHIYFQPTEEERYRRLLKRCKKELGRLIEDTNCNPILLRLAWTDAVTYDASLANDWPYCGGVNGSVRFNIELDHPANAGLSKAIDLLRLVKRKFSKISWADLIQMGAVVAIELAGGPTIKLNYGRIDCTFEQHNVAEKLKSATNTMQLKAACSMGAKHTLQRLYPSPVPPYPDGAPTPDVHLRNVFYRMGLDNRDIVALCGAHTLGRAFQNRTGVCIFSSGDQGATKFTGSHCIVKPDNSAGVGIAGGCSWTRNWLTFDNAYYRRIESLKDVDQLLWLPTDQALLDSPEFRPYFLHYARNQSDFFRDYADAHFRLSELGAKFKRKISLEPPPSDLKSNHIDTESVSDTAAATTRGGNEGKEVDGRLTGLQCPTETKESAAASASTSATSDTHDRELSSFERSFSNQNSGESDSQKSEASTTSWCVIS